MSGGESVAMRVTSIAMAKPWLQDRPGARKVRFTGRGRARLWKVEIVLGQREHQISIVAHTKALDRWARADPARRIVAQGFALRIGQDLAIHDSLWTGVDESDHAAIGILSEMDHGAKMDAPT